MSGVLTAVLEIKQTDTQILSTVTETSGNSTNNITSHPLTHNHTLLLHSSQQNEKRKMQTVGFEPTRANTLRPERSTLDHSVIFASVSILQHAYFKHTSHSSTFILPVSAFILHIQD